MRKVFQEISRRNFGLDLFRAIAVLIVILGHGFEMFGAKVFSNFPVDGVDLFFVLSGFLIGRMLLKTSSSGGFKLFHETLTFLKRRWFRTLPNYFLFLLINIFLVKFLVYDGLLNNNTALYFVFLQNFYIPLDFMFWESWSLAVEEWFYLLFPVLIIIVGVFVSKSKSYDKKYIVSVVMFLIVPLILRVLSFTLNSEVLDWDLYLRKIVVYRLDTIAFGLLGAWIYAQFGQKILKHSFVMFLFGLAGIVSFYLLKFDNAEVFKQTLYFSFQSLFILLCLPIFIRIRLSSKIIKNGIGLISILSYSLYLVHMPVLYLMLKFNLLSGVNFTGKVILFVVYLISSGLISTLVYFAWERPWTSLRSKKYCILGLRF